MLLGAFKLGNLIRFLPYPVMGGFLAGTGYLLTVGGISIMTDKTGLNLFAAEAAVRWLPAMALGLVLLVASRRTGNPLWLPIIVLAASLLFYLIAWAAGSSVATLSAQGWLVGGLTDTGLWLFPLSPDLLSQVSWPAIVAQIPVVLPMIFISAIALLLNANGLELIIKRDLDLNHELVITGIANLLSAFGGGIVGYHAISTSSLNHSLAPNRRLPGLVLAALLVLTIFLGASLVGYIPKFILGGLVIFVGLMLLADWVYDAWFNFPHIDFLIILLIVVTIAWQGFLVGVLVGFVAALVMFVISYSRTDVVRHSHSGADYQSRVIRTPESQAALAELCMQIYIMRLQGFIFFGTATTLFETVRDQADSDLIRYVILDFTNVNGLDSTALLSFRKMRQLANGKEISLLFTGMSPGVYRQFVRGGISDEGLAVGYGDTLDQGVAWCEDRLLAERPDVPSPLDNLVAQLQFILPGEAATRIMPYLTRLDINLGDYLIRQNDLPDLMYFIESGQVTAQLESDNSPPTRLETMQGGRVVGELGFYLGTPRTAAVVVDVPGVAYSLSRADLERMRDEDPAAADALQQIIIRLISQRLVHLTRAFQAMRD
jgi:SulP family sulfate permease